MQWIWAGVAIAAAFIVGAAASRVVRGRFNKGGGKLADFAGAAASMTMSLFIVAGLLVALGVIRAESLEELRDDAIRYFPRALSALIVVILGGVMGTLVSTGVRQSIGSTMGRAGEQIPSVIKAIVSAFAAILAASQLGIDTTVINIVVAACVFGLALAFALVVGFGSRPVATEVACGRAIRRMIAPGDVVSSDHLGGTVVAMHATAVEVVCDGQIALIPNSTFTESDFAVTRLVADDET